jgi:CheY-like chemotaxis protein
MVVDDEEFCISSMQAILFCLKVDVEHQVEFCITGLEALEQLKRTYSYGLQYKVIFTDFNMPLMNGIESTKQMRKYMAEHLGLARHEQPLIVGVTGHVQDSFKQEGLSAGMDIILAKPVSSLQIKNVLQRLHNI